MRYGTGRLLLLRCKCGYVFVEVAAGDVSFSDSVSFFEISGIITLRNSSGNLTFAPTFFHHKESSHDVSRTLQYYELGKKKFDDIEADDFRDSNTC